MRNSLKWIIAIITVTFVFGCGRALSNPGADFSLKSLEGSMVSLSDYQGKKNVVLTFWTTWCPHCTTEMKELKSQYPQLKANGFEIVAVNVQEASGTVKSYVEKQVIEFPVLLDRDGEVARNYGVRGIPAVFIVNKNGKVVSSGHRLPGNLNELVE